MMLQLWISISISISVRIGRLTPSLRALVNFVYFTNTEIEFLARLNDLVWSRQSLFLAYHFSCVRSLLVRFTSSIFTFFQTTQNKETEREKPKPSASFVDRLIPRPTQNTHIYKLPRERGSDRWLTLHDFFVLDYLLSSMALSEELDYAQIIPVDNYVPSVYAAVRTLHTCVVLWRTRNNPGHERSNVFY